MNQNLSSRIANVVAASGLEGLYTVMITQPQKQEREEIWELDGKGGLWRNSSARYTERRLEDNKIGTGQFYFRNDNVKELNGTIRIDAFTKPETNSPAPAFLGKIYELRANDKVWAPTGEYIAIKSTVCRLCKKSKSFERCVKNDPCKNCD